MNPDATPEPTPETPPEIIRRDDIPRPDSDIIAGASISVSHRSGPLPPIEDLAAYEEHFPGFGERILVLAEKRVLHDMEMEKSQLALEREVYTGDQKRSYLGNVAGRRHDFKSDWRWHLRDSPKPRHSRSRRCRQRRRSFGLRVFYDAQPTTERARNAAKASG